jgi:hypothetical protein
MTIKYSIDEKDYLKYLLFNASRSRLVKKRMMKSKYLGPAVYLILALVALIIHNQFLTVTFAIVAVLWFLLYPPILKWQYVKHYEKHIRENFSAKCNMTTYLEFQQDHLFIKDNNSELRIKKAEITDICEIAEAFYIKLKAGSSIVLPKDKVGDVQMIKEILVSLAANQGIKYQEQLNWRWKLI